MPKANHSIPLEYLKHLSYLEWLRELALFSWRKECSETIVPCVCIPAEKTEPDSFQWCPMPGPEATGTNGSTGSSLSTSGNTFYIVRVIEHLQRMPREVMESVFGGVQNLNGHGPGQPDGWLCLSTGNGQDDLQRGLPTSAILGYQRILLYACCCCVGKCHRIELFDLLHFLENKFTFFIYSLRYFIFLLLQTSLNEAKPSLILMTILLS